MRSHQLSCGHWITDWRNYRVGDVLACTKCDTLRTTVIGYSMADGAHTPGGTT